MNLDLIEQFNNEQNFISFKNKLKAEQANMGDEQIDSIATTIWNNLKRQILLNAPLQQQDLKNR